MVLLVNLWKVVQEVVTGICCPQDRENGLDGNWTLMDISFNPLKVGTDVDVPASHHTGCSPQGKGWDRGRIGDHK